VNHSAGSSFKTRRDAILEGEGSLWLERMGHSRTVKLDGSSEDQGRHAYGRLGTKEEVFMKKEWAQVEEKTTVRGVVRSTMPPKGEVGVTLRRGSLPVDISGKGTQIRGVTSKLGKQAIPV